ncbi:MAG TPA: glycosyltransferase family 9 protein [Longimicrobiales bacterium]|nr:glycosyltransferase family 9 protein [Longimicrobiales bacterium]
MESGARICMVLLTGLGDVVHGLPVVNALKRDDPARRITWVVEPIPAPLLHGHPAIDDVVVYHMRRGVAGVRELWRTLHSRDFDLAVNLNIYFKSVWPTVLSGAPVRWGFDRTRSRDMVWLFHNRRLPERPRRHTQDMFLEFLDVLGVAPEPLAWNLALTDAERAEHASFFDALGRDRPVVSIVPATANPKKDWFADRFARVVDALEHDFGYRTLLVGGPSERERHIAADIEAKASASPVNALGDGIRRLMWLLAGSDLVIAPDTGPVHIARALAVPVIGLYGHTNPWRVGPYRWCHDLWVDAYTDAAPDPSAWDPKLDRMERITVDEVLERVERARLRYVQPRNAQARGAHPSGPARPDGPDGDAS